MFMTIMSEKILTIDKSNMVISLYREKLEVDFKEGILQKVEEIVEDNPILGDSLGFLMQSVFPLDVMLRDIEAVESEVNKIRIIIPLRKDIEIPLTESEIDLLKNRLAELIPIEKNKYYSEILARARALEEAERDKWKKVSKIT